MPLLRKTLAEFVGTVMPIGPWRVLFRCTHNSARSQTADRARSGKRLATLSLETHASFRPATVTRELTGAK